MAGRIRGPQGGRPVLRVEIKVLDPRLHEWGLPSYQTAGAAAIDLIACIDGDLLIRPQAPAVLIPSGIALFCDTAGIAGLVLPRSGLGHKKGLVMGNSVGLIDSDYTGQIQISAWNRNPPGSDPILIRPGERIAQMMFVPVLHPEFALVQAFSGETDRGGGGFGSTGG